MVIYVLGVEEQRTEGTALAGSGRKKNQLAGKSAVLYRNLLSPRHSEDAGGWFDFCGVCILCSRNVWVKRICYQLLFPSKENTENSEL